MENEILQQILSKLTSMESDIKELKQEQKELKQEQQETNLRLNKLEESQQNLTLVVENELKRDIKIIAENHLSLNQKLDDLKGISEKVFDLQDDTTILKSITKDTLYDLKALKVAK